MSEIVKNLNEAQRSAVINYKKPSLIVAGAGSGKTRVLTSRIAYMMEQGVEPWHILALTFTNKAAAEMRERISQVVSKEKTSRLWMGTFHSIFLKILRMEVDKLGYPSSFTIYDTADSRNLIKSIIKEMNLNDESYKPNAIQSRISLAKNNLVGPEAYAANAAYIAEDRHKKMPDFVEVYRAYARRCRDNGAMDFDDMLLNINILFKDFPEVLAKYQQRFKYILVDEYQDTNYAQYIIIRRLAQMHSNVCVVGDDAQSIYSFRGAKIENILRFRNDYPDAMTFKLEQNYRSTQNIVNAANSVIERNKNRLEKSSFSKGEAGEKIKVLKAYTDQEEAAMVADEIRTMVRDSGAAWSDVALLYRTNMQSRGFEEAFRKRSIPYVIYGGMSFYQRKEVKDLLAYIKLIVNPRDDEAFKRIINYPARGIGDVTLGRIVQSAKDKNLSCFEIAESGDLKEVGLNAGAQKRVAEFTEMIRTLSAKTTTTELYEFGVEVATQSGIIGSFRAEQTPEAQSAIDNIEELLNSLQLFSDMEEGVMEFDQQTGEPIEGESVPPSIADWLQSITLITDMDKDNEEDNNRVTMMTIHAAKGLEYKYVFIVGLEENLFPSLMSMDGADGLEEERRLFYVALTRAREAAVLSFSQSRFKWGSMEFCSPSRFLSEINPEYLDASFDLEQIGTDVESTPSSVGERGDNIGRKGSYGGAKTEYGAAANRYRAASQRAKQTTPEEVLLPSPRVGEGTRFKSVGSRIKESAHSQADTATRADSGAYSIGQRVAHAKFGIGTITNIEQTSSDSKITVQFDERAAGQKTLLTKFAKLAIVG